MPASDVQREIDMTSKSESVGFDLRYVIRFFGRHFYTLLWPSFAPNLDAPIPKF